MTEITVITFLAFALFPVAANLGVIILAILIVTFAFEVFSTTCCGSFC